MKLKMTLLAAVAFLGAATAFTTTTLSASTAKAHPSLFCRDCPFPAKVGDGRWVMPNGIIQVEIDENPYGQGRSQVDVVLRDVRSGYIVARGVVIQTAGRKTMSVDLMDREGRQIKGFVRYLDANKNNIQAKFTCEECTIAPMLD